MAVPGETAPAATAALEAVGLVKSFGAVRAVRGVSLAFPPGAVTALLGENGAGKSTLIRLCSGEMQPDDGHLLLAGERVQLRSTMEAVRAGVVVVHQEPQLVGELSVADNLFLYDLGERPGAAMAHRGGHVRKARELLERLGMSDTLPDPATACRDLSAAERQLVDIVRALSRDPRVLFLDEPNSSLTHEETERLFRVVRRMRADGVAVVLVSHRLAEVYEIADHVVVLRDGQFVASGDPHEIDQARAVRLMAGARLTAVAREAARDRQDVEGRPAALELIRCSGPGFEDVSFALRPGEIVGMAGLVGAGRTEIAAGVVGMTRITRGTLEVDGRPVRISSPRAAQRLGLSYVAEERRTEVFAGQSVGYNLTVRVLEHLGRAGLVSPRRQRGLARQLTQRFNVKTPTVATPITALSGGNQQKVLVARALATGPRVLILDEPTRGVDVGTKAEIYQALRDLAHREGLAVWFISSEMEEVLELADRVLVVRHGRIVRDAPNTADPTPLIAAAMGA